MKKEKKKDKILVEYSRNDLREIEFSLEEIIKMCRNHINQKANELSSLMPYRGAPQDPYDYDDGHVCEDLISDMSDLFYIGERAKSAYDRHNALKKKEEPVEERAIPEF